MIKFRKGKAETGRIRVRVRVRITVRVRVSVRIRSVKAKPGLILHSKILRSESEPYRFWYGSVYILTQMHRHLCNRTFRQ